MIYSIFYLGNLMDRDAILQPFPGLSYDAVAHNTNGDGHAYYRAGTVWREWGELTDAERRRLRRGFPDLTPKETQ